MDISFFVRVFLGETLDGEKNKREGDIEAFHGPGDDRGDKFCDA